jgi:hypothetical protein
MRAHWRSPIREMTASARTCAGSVGVALASVGVALGSEEGAIDDGGTAAVAGGVETTDADTLVVRLVGTSTLLEVPVQPDSAMQTPRLRITAAHDAGGIRYRVARRRSIRRSGISHIAATTT